MSRPAFARMYSWLRAPLAAVVLLTAAASAASALLLAGGCASRPAEPAQTRPEPSIESPSSAETQTTFAVIGDFGMADDNESAVASLVASWKPEVVVALGDNYYSEAGGTGTGRYDRSVGAYYCSWLKDVTTTGGACAVGEAPDGNAFVPALGNHDYTDAGLDTYLEYFTLPGNGMTDTSGNERYYEYRRGPVSLFVVNSEEQEPDGTSASSKQAQWLKARLAASTAPWKIVCFHRPAHSSDAKHGSDKNMRWPFAEWGADVVLSGHAHTYERVMADGIVYFVNGAGGAELYSFAEPVAGSEVRYNADWGAQRVTATPDALEFRFLNTRGDEIDSYRLTK